MGIVKVLIKFISPYTAGNVISGLALEPELLVLVGYGDVLSDAVRNRCNYFFHHRKLQTVLAEPVRLERHMEPDIEAKLQTLLTKYAELVPAIDITDADAEEGLALGVVLRGHKNWRFPILETRVRDSSFLLQKHAEIFKRLSFPALRAEEFRFLGTGVSGAVGSAEAGGSCLLVRKDLDRATIRLIRGLYRLYAADRGYWESVAEVFRRSEVGTEDGRTEYLLDARELPVCEESLEDLTEAGVLERHVRRGGILRLVFTEARAVSWLLHIERLPLLHVFLTTAFVREYGRAAAYHDLELRDEGLITCIRRCLPVVLTYVEDVASETALYAYYRRSGRLFDGPLRRILVHGETAVSADIASAAEELGIELTEPWKLSGLLEPR